MKICSIDGCDKKVLARGWCDKHYMRWWMHGDTATVLRAQNGSGTVMKNGYILRVRGDTKNYVHIQIAEDAIGHPLPTGAEVHHVDGNRANNDPSNLVVCPNRKYHRLLHQRQRALAACGNANWRLCRYCKQHDDPVRLKIAKVYAYHDACNAAHVREVNKRKREPA